MSIVKPVGGADDFPREHGIVVHFASGNVCRVKDTTIADLADYLENAALKARELDKPEPNWVRAYNGPWFQIKNVDYVEEY